MTSEPSRQFPDREDASENDRPLVSVVIPAARVDAYLLEAMASVFEQAYPCIELVVVLDGAPRSELPLPLGGPNLRILSFERRQGTPTALNAGLGASAGSLIARLDADDLALSGRIEAQVRYFCEHPDVGCVGSGVVLIDEGGSIAGPGPSFVSGDDVGAYLIQRNILVHSSVMYRASVIGEVGGYTLSMQRMQDYDLFLRMARVSTLGVIPNVLTAYRVHGGQFSRLTSPWKSYTWNILRERRLLARHLGRSVIRQRLRNAAWHAAQVLRYYRLRRPGYRKVAES